MARNRAVLLWMVALLALLLVACEGYAQTGVRTTSHQNNRGGEQSVRVKKANGTAEQEFQVDGGSGLILETDLTLSVGAGTFKIELLGEDDRVTLTLEAHGGQAVSGHGQMVVDAFDEANYRVTAAEAENVEYTIEYTFR